MRVAVTDDRPEYASRDRFPDAAELAVVEYDPDTQELAPLPIPGAPPYYVVVATWGWDEPALAQVLTAEPPPAYVGLVASSTKARVIRERLQARGLSKEVVGRVRAPVGLDLGAETPEEIALSILAEILLVRRGASGRPMGEGRAKEGGRSRE
jgi:xanthine dehydrogenase accessory factor